MIEYGPDQHREVDVEDVSELAAFRDTEAVAWIDVQGLGDTAVLEQIGELFDLHVLALEDAVNAPVRPKAELYEHNHLVVTRMARIDDADIVLEQVTIFIGRRWVITFQERLGDVLDPVRRRTRSGARMVTKGPDYLAYAIIDSIIDGFYPVLDVLGERLEDLEARLLEGPSEEMLGEIYRIRREMVALRRSVWPQRDAVTELIRDESPFVSEETRMFLRDCYDHAVQISEVIESYRDLCGSLMELYMSAQSHRMNQVMQVLTIMASIFIPLTFIAGVYGMNFEHMPELHYRWGYPLALTVMLILGVGMLWFFRARGWLVRPPREEEG